MDPAVFEEWMMIILVTVLIGFMGFIVWDLAKKIQGGQVRDADPVLRAGARGAGLHHQERGGGVSRRGVRLKAAGSVLRPRLAL